VGQPEVIASLDVTKIPQENCRSESRNATSRSESGDGSDQQTYEVALPNLKKLEERGRDNCAAQTQGTSGTIHGPALFREFQLMKQAGLRRGKFFSAPPLMRRTFRR